MLSQQMHVEPSSRSVMFKCSIAAPFRTHRVPLSFVLAVWALGLPTRSTSAGECTVTPSPFWSNAVAFPDDPFRAESSIFGDPGWIKFTVLTCDLQTVYFQDTQSYPFHYDFATERLDPFIGLSLEAFNDVTLFNNGREAILGAVVMPFVSGAPPTAEFPEYGIQFIATDPIDIMTVIDLFQTVESSVTAEPGVQALYFPTFEQVGTALDNIDLLAANGITVSSPARWDDGNSCYAHGWALGPLKFFAAEDIDAAFLAGDLTPADILLTDGVPASIPLVAGLISLTPATPNSHVAILAGTFQVPFAYLARPQDADRAIALQGRRVVLRAYPDVFDGPCHVDVIDIEDELSSEQVDEILALKTPPPLVIPSVTSPGVTGTNTDMLTVDDVRFFGGKASNFGILRRSLPDQSPVAAALSFDAWTAFLDQPLLGGGTLRTEIAGILAGSSYPPPNMQALGADLDAIQAMIKDEGQTVVEPALQAAIIDVLQDPQFSFDPAQRIRFRSSTNVEDSEQFTGAGLYDSRSGCLMDDLDGDDLGPSHCNPAEPEERGVFRALRRVFASFYNDSAFLERLRHGVDEDDVGMAVLVHHSFPDEFELANGVATYHKKFTTEMTLVSQLGASSVTNPEPGTIPEVVDIFVFSGGTQFWPTLITPSNLVLLGDHVLTWVDGYVELAQLLKTAADQFEIETGKTQYVLDFEYKLLAPGGAALPQGGLVIKQIREIPQPDDTPNITPFLVNAAVEYRVVQGRAGNVFSNHRLKALWSQQTKNMWLDPAVLANTTIFADSALTYFDGCSLGQLAGPMESFPSFVHGYAPHTLTAGWNLSLANPRDCALTMDFVGAPVSAAESPIVTLADLGFTRNGNMVLQVEHDQAVLSYEYDWQAEPPVLVPSWDTTDTVMVQPRFEDISNVVLYEHDFVFDPDITISTSYYLKPTDGICAGCIFPLSSWVDTTIAGFTSEPIVLTSEWAQSYEAGQHNFTEWFLFEPRLDPGVPADLLAELEAQDIDQIVVFSAFGVPDMATIDLDACTCSVATGLGACADLDADGIRDDGCMWWECSGGACEGTPVAYADMGGGNGACAPDGTADGNDRFHALNCFSNVSTLGAGGYPCAANPPATYNVDVAGLNAPCTPDGVCDGNDAFAALNAFSGTTTCSCPGGPQPGEFRPRKRSP